jgi:ankyrin repeat protein
MLAFSENKPTALHRFLHYVKNNHLERIKQLINSKEISLSDINHRNTQGQSAIILASAYNHGHIVDFLLENGADPNITDNAGNNALLIIIGGTCHSKNKKALNIHLKIIASLINAEINLEHKNKNNRSALMMIMCCKTHVESIYLLLDRLQLNFLFNKKYDATSKTLANFLIYLDSLIDKKQIKNINKEESEIYDEALYQISEEGKPVRDFIKETEKRFYNTAESLLTEKDIHPLRYLNNRYFLKRIGVLEFDNNTDSHIAVSLSFKDHYCLSMLINAEKNLNHRNNNNESILMLALINAVKNGAPIDVHILFLILEVIHKKLLLNISISSAEKKFHMFESYINKFIDKKRISDCLSENEVKISETLMFDIIALLRTKILKSIFSAAATGDAETLFNLLVCEEINCQDHKGDTPLFKAILYEEHNFREAKANNPLFYFTCEDHFPIVKTLVEEYKANVNARNHANKTPLSLAFDLKHYPIINYLLEKIDEQSIETLLIYKMDMDHAMLSHANKTKIKNILKEHHKSPVKISEDLHQNVLLFNQCKYVKCREILNNEYIYEPESEVKIRLSPC